MDFTAPNSGVALFGGQPAVTPALQQLQQLLASIGRTGGGGQGQQPRQPQQQGGQQGAAINNPMTQYLAGQIPGAYDYLSSLFAPAAGGAGIAGGAGLGAAGLGAEAPMSMGGGVLSMAV